MPENQFILSNNPLCSKQRVYICCLLYTSEDEVTIYRLESVAGKSFLAFQNHPLAIDVIFRNIIPLYGLENIEYIETVSYTHLFHFLT